MAHFSAVLFMLSLMHRLCDILREGRHGYAFTCAWAVRYLARGAARFTPLARYGLPARRVRVAWHGRAPARRLAPWLVSITWMMECLYKPPPWHYAKT